MRRAIVPMVLMLAACQSEVTGEAARDTVALPADGETPGPAATAPTGVAAPALALDVEGLRLVLDSGATRLLAFGTPRDRAEEAVARVDDSKPKRTSIEECGAGPLEFTAYGPLQLNFQDGKFVGWFLDGPGGPTTVDGVGIGSTRAQLQSARTLTPIPDSTLGEEFMLGELTEDSIGGLFEGPWAEAKVSQLFAGINCFFR